MEALVGLIGFILIGYISGTVIEKRHYSKIEKREKELLSFPVVTFEDIDDVEKIEQAQLVIGSVVISLDYFKRFLAGLRNIVGGHLSSYESLLDRGRRESILRMKEKAKELGADLILNMRFETSGIGQSANRKRNIGCFEVLAYGTAVKFKRA